MFGWKPVTPLCIGGKVRSISSPEKKGLQKRPDTGKSPMFAKDVCRVGFPLLPTEVEISCCSCFSNIIVVIKIESFGENGSKDGVIGDHCLVVFKHVVLGVDGYTKISECQADVNDLVNSCPCCYKI